MHALPESITALALNNPVVHVFAKQHQAGFITVEAALEGMVVELAAACDRALDVMLEAEAKRPIEIVVTFDSLPPDLQAKIRGNVRLVAPLADAQTGERYAGSPDEPS